MRVLLNRIELRMGEGVVTGAPHIISSLGLGSCVVVILYDSQRKIGGVAHIMLPDSNSVNGYHTPYQCANTAITALIEEMRDTEATRQNLMAKMVGGARMFADYDGSSTGIGDQNIMNIKQLLERERIALIGEQIGGNYGRSIEFYLDSGKVIVRAVGKEDKEI